MRKLLILSLAIAAGLTATGSFLSVETSALQKSKFVRATQPVPNQYLVALDDNYVGRSASAPEVEAEAEFLSSVYGGDVRRVFSNALKGYSVNMTPEQAEALSRNERVRFVEEDAVVSLSATQANAGWNLDRVDQRSLPMDTTFSYTNSGAGAHVYIIDTGIRITHQEFGGRASVVFDAVNDGQTDCNGHGTHVAATAVGATYGVAKNAFVHSARVLNCSGQGTISNIAAAMDWITANRVNPAVVNISITAAGMSPFMETALTNSFASGVVYTVSAGNSNLNACDYSPGRTPNAITVGAMAQQDQRAPFSNWGSCVDMHAPGYEILSAGIASDTASRELNGTSMAAPLVAGVLAVYRAANPSASPTAVTNALNSTATTGILTGVDATTANRLVYSWMSGSPPPPTPTPTPTATPTPTPTATPTPTPTPTASGTLRIKKRVRDQNGGTSSSTAFPYQATNISTPTFTLISNQEFTDSNVPAGAQVVAVTESSVEGWRLDSVECVEVAGTTPNIPNTTVDLANHRANIIVESGEQVTCTFTSEELAPTAGEGEIGGRILDARGMGVRGVSLSLFNANSGETVYATTNNFGYYSFTGLELTNFYVVTAFGTKRYSIPDNERSFSLNDNRFNVDFLAEMTNWW